MNDKKIEKKLVIAVFVVAVLAVSVFGLLLYAIVGAASRPSASGAGVVAAPVESLAYPELSTIYLSRPLGVFDYYGDEHIGLLGPGYFELVDLNGAWAQVLDDGGIQRQVYLNFWPSTRVLTEFFRGLPYDVSIYYTNIETGFTFGFRDNVTYTSASLNKASHALYVYHLAEIGATDLSRIHTIRSFDIRGGTGRIHRYPNRIGLQLTHLELLRYSVLYSDNTAFRVLYMHYQHYSPSYFEFMRGLGRDMGHMGEVRTRTVTAAQMGLLMRHIHNYIETETELALHFQESMLNSDVPIIMSDYPVAQKYGHWDGAFHDIGIIYAPSPYILVILTNMDRAAPFHLFEEISMFIQEFNNRYFVGGGE
ncbi:MAG: class A beta-lactamase-related serine hydrolase [Defluviitaleaceae bacterium]|nr:class A beta-lactamase-related serine hydrolase [Defluviitaleaceae bacterium]